MGHWQALPATLAEAANGLNQLQRRRHGDARLQLLQQLCQRVMALLQQIRQWLREAVAAVDQTFVQGFEFMGEIANRANLGHACTTLEGVQITLQRGQRRFVVRVGPPARFVTGADSCSTSGRSSSSGSANSSGAS